MINFSTLSSLSGRERTTSVETALSEETEQSQGAGVLDPKSWKRVSHEDLIARLKRKEEERKKSPQTVSGFLSPHTISAESPLTISRSNSADLWQRGLKVEAKVEAVVTKRLPAPSNNSAGFWTRGQKV